ncbi:MAG: ABC transporter permease [Candidatus Methylomirabilales bacterium]
MQSIRRGRWLARLGWGVYLGGLVATLWLIFLLLFMHSFFEGVTLEFPPTGLTLENYTQITGQFFPALRLSLLLGLAAGLLNVVLAIPASFVLSRYEFRGKNLINAFLLAPNMVPAISLALGLLALYSAVRLMDTFWGLTMALSIITMPYMLRSVMSAFNELDPALEEAAWTLGASRWRTFRLVLLPLIGPGVLAGLLLSFIIAFNEFTIIIFLYGPRNLPASVWLWNMLFMYGITPQFAAAVAIMQLVSFGVLYLLVGVIGRRYLQGVVF